MSIQTNLLGRLRNTPLPVTSGLHPLFEAIVNSIHAIDEASIAPELGIVRIKINRAPNQTHLEFDKNKKRKGRDPQSDIVGFIVTDNGIGFNDDNMAAFKTLDTDHKVSIGGRGIGRLLWLKAFTKVEVYSCFIDNKEQLKQRSFVFDASSGVRDESPEEAPDNSARQTVLSLIGFDEKYRRSTYKTASTIASAIFEHCLWYFVRPGGAPKIIVEDEGESIDLHRVYEDHMHSSAVREAFQIKNKDFELLHVKLRARSSSEHSIAYCADNRLVSEEKLAGKIPGLHGRLSDDKGDFIYVCYVSSELLDKCARPERTGFDMPDDLGELFAGTEISWNDIKNEVSAKASGHLVQYLEDVRQKGKERVEKFVATRAPRYRPIVARIPEEALYVDPDISDKDLDLALHRYLADIESDLLAKGHDLMDPNDNEAPDDYRTRLEVYLSEAEDIKKSDLANYVSHRKVILDLLEVAIQKTSKGNYSREDVIHSLIMPMRKDSSEVLFESCNLWLIDERLAFHDYLASDKPLSSMPITGSTQNKEPDIVALNVFDNPVLVSEGDGLPLASIVVVEIKRPMRAGAGAGEADDPIEQALGYLDRIRKGTVTTKRGRPILPSEDIPGFCYVVCDIRPTIAQRCRVHGMTRTSDGMGYFHYNAPMKAYMEVISFDRLVAAAKERNRAFFDKLGLPNT